MIFFKNLNFHISMTGKVTAIFPGFPGTVGTLEKENGSKFTNIDCFDKIFYVHSLGAYVQMCTRYEVFMIKPVARPTDNDGDDNDS